MKGEPDAMPDCYSESLKVLVKHLLKKDPAKRPTVNQILTFPNIKQIIPQVLSMKIFKDEFSHTILH